MEEREEINFIDFAHWVYDTQREKVTRGFYEQHDGKTYRQLLKELEEEIEADPENKGWEEIIDALQIKSREE